MLQLNILTPGCAMWHNGKTRCGINHGCFCFWDWCLDTLVVLVLILVSLAKIFVCLLPLFLTQSGSPHQCQPRNTLQQVCKSVCCKQQQRTHCSSDVWRCFFKAQAHRQPTATAVAMHIADWTHHLVLSVSLQLLPQLNFQVRTFCLLLSPTGHEQHLHSIEKTVAAMTHHHHHRSRLLPSALSVGLDKQCEHLGWEPNFFVAKATQMRKSVFLARNSHNVSVCELWSINQTG